VRFGNENDRPYVFKAPTEGVAAMSAVVQAAKPHLKTPFGVDYLWDPVASVAIGAATGASFGARSSPLSSPPTWGSGSPIAPTPSACVTISAAPT
jgi:hypothetical protein